MATSQSTAISPDGLAATYSRNLLSYTVTNALYPICADGGHRIFFIKHGSCIVYLGGYALRLHEGDFVYVGRHLSHGFALESNSALLMSGISSKDVREFTAFALESNLRFLVVRDSESGTTHSSLLRDMASRPQQKIRSVHTASQLMSLLDIIVKIVEEGGYSCPSLPQTKRDELAEMVFSLSVQPDASIARLAQRAGLTTTYMSRIFKSLYGVSFPVYRSIMLINSARRLLIQSDKSVREVAALCNYTSLRSFNREFKEVAGMTPTAYRKFNSTSKVVDYGTGPAQKPLRSFYQNLLLTCPEPPAIELPHSHQGNVLR